MAECYLRPFPGRCVVEREGFKYKGILTIPDKAKQLPTIGRVVAIGDPDDSTKAALLGKRVVWGRYSGIAIRISNQPVYDVFSYEELLSEVCSTEEISFEMEDTSLMTRE